jgi:glycosyltransferase involved in cell wall biosynthesis
MRVALVYPWFGENLGYIENCLPKALATLGADVHLITSDLQPGFDSPHYRELYEPFLGPAVQPVGTTQRDGYTHHRLPHALYGKHVGVRGLTPLLRRLRPDVVQTSSPTSAISLEVALARPLLGYRLFTGAHQCASTISNGSRGGVSHALRRSLGHAARFAPGRVIGLLADGCHAVTGDARELAVDRYGVPPERVSVRPLGVDTDLFHPLSGPEEARARAQLREEIGIAPDAVLCIYTGRMTAAKNPLLLARAVETLRERGHAFAGLFIGGGPEAESVASVDGNRVHPYVPYRELPRFFRAADIAVWPAQESSSQADALACGLPTVISDQIRKQELLDAGAATYSCGDLDDLARVLASLADPAVRAEHRERAERALGALSWRTLAEQRLRDYERAGAGSADR